MWASDIIRNFLSKSSPTDILEKEVLTSDRISMINVKYRFCSVVMVTLLTPNPSPVHRTVSTTVILTLENHSPSTSSCFLPIPWTDMLHFPSKLQTNGPSGAPRRSTDLNATQHKPLHTLYFHRLKKSCTMLAECIHMDRKKIYVLPWIWSSIEWYNWWAPCCCLVFDRCFYKILIDSPFARFYIVFPTKRCV